MRMFSIASGSSGNVSYVGSEKTHLLVDVGISAKRISEALKEAQLQMRDISAILLTHEHIDHIRALGVLSRKYEIPVYSSPGTLEGIQKCKSLGDFDLSLVQTIAADEDMYIGDICVHPFHIRHDANETFAYRLSCGNTQFAVATDIGSYDAYTVENLRGLDGLLLEANHDIRMLETGPYTYDLKRRILGDFGHLSNENSGRLLCEVLHDTLQRVYLGHLSAENNYPDLALQAVKCEIDLCSEKYKSGDFHIEVAPREGLSSILEL